VLTEKQKEIGRLNLLQILQGLEAFTLRLFTEQLEWSIEQIQVMLVEIRDELRDQKLQAMLNLYVLSLRSTGSFS
jgi:hypothetical protein